MPRAEWAQPGDPRACGVASPGEESLAAAIAARRSRLCRPVARSRHQEAARVARQTDSQGEDGADMVPARGHAQQAKEQKISYEIFLPLPARNGHLVGEGIQILRHPHLYPLRPWRAQDEIIHSQRDLSSRDWIIAQSPKDGPVRPARSSPREPSSETSPAR